MVIKDLKRFDEFARSFGNRYLAVRLISKWARELGQKFSEYSILESRLLAAVLDGRCFYSEEELAIRKKPTTDDHIEEFLEWVIDDDIVAEVKNLYKQSIKNRKLTECSNPNFSSGQIARTNVLLRMIWYSADTEKGD